MATIPRSLHRALHRVVVSSHCLVKCVPALPLTMDPQTQPCRLRPAFARVATSKQSTVWSILYLRAERKKDTLVVVRSCLLFLLVLTHFRLPSSAFSGQVLPASCCTFICDARKASAWLSRIAGAPGWHFGCCTSPSSALTLLHFLKATVSSPRSFRWFLWPSYDPLVLASNPVSGIASAGLSAFSAWNSAHTLRSAQSSQAFAEGESQADCILPLAPQAHDTSLVCFKANLFSWERQGIPYPAGAPQT